MIRSFLGAIFASSIFTIIIFYTLALSHIRPISLDDLNKKPTLLYRIYKPKRLPKKAQPVIKKQKPPVKKIKQKQRKTISKKISRTISKDTISKKEESPTPITELSQEAKIIHPVIPKYPPIAQKAGIEASVFLEMIINEKGKVEYVSVAFCSHPGYNFEKNAIEAAKKLRFEPFIQDGNPIKVKLVYPINFVLVE